MHARRSGGSGGGGVGGGGGGGGGDDGDDDDDDVGGGGGGGGARRKNTSRLASRVPAEDSRCRCRPLCSCRAPYGANFAPLRLVVRRRNGVFETETRVRAGGESGALSSCAAFYGKPRSSREVVAEKQEEEEEDVSWFCAKRNRARVGARQ